MATRSRLIANFGPDYDSASQVPDQQTISSSSIGPLLGDATAQAKLGITQIANPYYIPPRPVGPRSFLAKTTARSGVTPDQALISANRRKNPFLIPFTPSADLFGINIPS